VGSIKRRNQPPSVLLPEPEFPDQANASRPARISSETSIHRALPAPARRPAESKLLLISNILIRLATSMRPTDPIVFHIPEYVNDTPVAHPATSGTAGQRRQHTHRLGCG